MGGCFEAFESKAVRIRQRPASEQSQARQRVPSRLSLYRDQRALKRSKTSFERSEAPSWIHSDGADLVQLSQFVPRNPARWSTLPSAQAATPKASSGVESAMLSDSRCATAVRSIRKL